MKSGSTARAPRCSRPPRSTRTSSRVSTGCTRSPTESTTAGAKGLVAEVDELDRNVRDGFTDQLNRSLQVVLLAAGDAHRVALDRGRDLELRVLDELLDLPA